MLAIGAGPVDDDSLLALVDWLGDAGDDDAAVRAHHWVRRSVDLGMAPPGLRRIAEGLLVGAGERPAPFPPRDAADSVVVAVRDSPLVVLAGATADDVARAVGELVDQGHRVIVTGADAVELDAVRIALPGTARRRVVDALPRLLPAELHRLRGLLVTSTPARRARPAQQLPELTALPDVDEVAALCAVAVRSASAGTELVAGVLRGLDDERRAAVTGIAGCVRRSLQLLDARPEPWVRAMVDDLVHNRRRSEFESVVQSTAQALTALNEGRDDPPVQVCGPMPEGVMRTLAAYFEYLDAGGRTRSYFQPAAQREVEPLLRLLRVGGRRPETADDLVVLLQYFALGQRLAVVDADCAVVGLPAPRERAELEALSEALAAVAATLRSVSALRHDVLFLQPGSPVAVPDLAAAEQFARAVLDYQENGSPSQAGERLDALAGAVEALAPTHATAPEHLAAVSALRARDAAGYAEALEQLAGAHRELYDERRSVALLAELGTLAEAWAAADFGLAWFTAAEALLEELPAPDAADVAVVLDAGGLSADRALLAAAAPRLVATVAPATEPPVTGLPGPDPEAAGPPATTLLGLLHRASAVVVGGREPAAAAPVVPLTRAGA